MVRTERAREKLDLVVRAERATENWDSGARGARGGESAETSVLMACERLNYNFLTFITSLLISM